MEARAASPSTGSSGQHTPRRTSRYPPSSPSVRFVHSAPHRPSPLGGASEPRKPRQWNSSPSLFPSDPNLFPPEWKLAPHTVPRRRPSAFAASQSPQGGEYSPLRSDSLFPALGPSRSDSLLEHEDLNELLEDARSFGISLEADPMPTCLTSTFDSDSDGEEGQKATGTESLKRIKNGFRSLGRSTKPAFHLGDTVSSTSSPSLHRTIASIGRRDSPNLGTTPPRSVGSVDASAASVSIGAEAGPRASHLRGTSAPTFAFTGHQWSCSGLDSPSPFRLGSIPEHVSRPPGLQGAPWPRSNTDPTPARATVLGTEPPSPTPAQTISRFGQPVQDLLVRMADAKAVPWARSASDPTPLGGTPTEPRTCDTFQVSLPERPSSVMDVSRPTDEARASKRLSVRSASDANGGESKSLCGRSGVGSALPRTNASQLLESLLAEVQQQSHEAADQASQRGVPASLAQDGPTSASSLSAWSVDSPTVACAESATLPLAFPRHGPDSYADDQEGFTVEEAQEDTGSDPARDPSRSSGPGLIRGMTGRRPQNQDIPLSASSVYTSCSFESAYHGKEVHSSLFQFRQILPPMPSHGSGERETCSSGRSDKTPSLTLEGPNKNLDELPAPSVVLPQHDTEQEEQPRPWGTAGAKTSTPKPMRLIVRDEECVSTLEALRGSARSPSKAPFPTVRHQANLVPGSSKLKPPQPLAASSSKPDDLLAPLRAPPSFRSIQPGGIVGTEGCNAVGLTVNTAAAVEWALSPTSLTRSPYRSSTGMTQENAFSPSELAVPDRARPASSSFVERPATPDAQLSIMHLFGSNAFDVDSFQLAPLEINSGASEQPLAVPFLSSSEASSSASPQEASYLDMSEDEEEDAEDEEADNECSIYHVPYREPSKLS